MYRGVTNRRNRPGTLKLSEENDQNMRKRRVLTTCSNRVSGGHKASKSARNPKTVCYSPRERPKYAKTTSFDDTLKSCVGGHKPKKSAQNLKTVCYSPQIMPKYAKSVSFDDALKSCISGHKPSKSAWNLKIACYSPQIMPKYAKTTSFHDVLKSCIRGSQTVENWPRTLKHCAIAHKNGQNMRKR